MQQTTHAASEFVLADSAIMISKGDLNGRITYVNRDFVEVSGYAEEELLGAPQSILASPDTPRAVFEDFLRTVRSGKTWAGVGKGRRKNGDYFWVGMSAAPIYEARRLVGFITIRMKADREHVRIAERAYAALHSGKSRLRIQEGRIVHAASASRLHALIELPYVTRTRVLCLSLAALFALDFADRIGEMHLPVTWLAAAAAAGAALSAAQFALARRSIAQPLARVERLIDDMSEGNLSDDIEAYGNSETARIAHALRGLQMNLKLLVSQIQETTGLVNGEAGTIRNGSADLSGRTETQAASLEQIAASMAELTTAVTRNADSAREANRLSSSTSQLASQGRHAVQEVVATMASITDSAHRIGDIIGVIDSIAFQTNILALNAAVEAARAGEHGRGFAVVASEVRHLAQRCADAAKEIRSLIGESVTRVETGSRLVDDAGATIISVVASVERVAGFMDEIAAASQQQREGIGQVGEALTQMEHATRSNRQVVEQADAASRRMHAQASKLARLVGSFRLSKGYAPSERVDESGDARGARLASSPHGRTAAPTA